jgi:hypothetical protein
MEIYKYQSFLPNLKRSQQNIQTQFYHQTYSKLIKRPRMETNQFY